MMSGGSMNYLYSRIEMDASFIEDTPERKAFAKHLKLVAKALRDIEWVDSGDCGPGFESDAIRACLSAEFILDAAIADAQTVLEQSHGDFWKAGDACQHYEIVPSEYHIVEFDEKRIDVIGANGNDGLHYDAA